MKQTLCDKPNYATAEDLPPELITRIVELLSGDWPEFWAEDYLQTLPPRVESSKREFGHCSLVCKYWAKILRPGIFSALTLNSAEDGHQFHSFMRCPVHPDLSIAKLVQKVTINYDLAAPAWFHLVFLCWQPEFGDAFDPPVNVTVINSASNPENTPVSARSFYHSLPRPLPPRVAHIGTLALRNLSFPNFSCLRQFLASVWVARAAELVLDDVHIQDIEMVPVQFRGSRLLTAAVNRGNAPLRLFRSLLSTHQRRKNRIEGHAVLTVEKVLLVVMQSCPVFREWASPWSAEGDGHREATEAPHQHPRSCIWSFSPNEDDEYGTSPQLSVYRCHR